MRSSRLFLWICLWIGAVANADGLLSQAPKVVPFGQEKNEIVRVYNEQLLRPGSPLNQTLDRLQARIADVEKDVPQKLRSSVIRNSITTDDVWMTQESSGYPMRPDVEKRYTLTVDYKIPIRRVTRVGAEPLPPGSLIESYVFVRAIRLTPDPKQIAVTSEELILK